MKDYLRSRSLLSNRACYFLSPPKTFWNFTKLQRLECRGPTALTPFKNSEVDYTNIVETLIIERYLWYPHPDKNNLDKFISKSKAITTLIAINAFLCIPISAICLHGNTLRTLAFCESNNGLAEFSPATGIPLSINDLDLLNRSCPYLSSITLDLVFPEVCFRSNTFVFGLRIYININLAPRCPAPAHTNAID